MQGNSFRPFFQKETSRKTPLFFDGNNTNLIAGMSSYALIMGDYKLITNKQNLNTGYELYNLTADPGEKNDIFEKQPEVVEKMLRLISEFREKNEQLRKYNLTKIDKKVNLSEEWEKTRQTLKALGYIN
jgi:arylsulfatase A-like enzyme